MSWISERLTSSRRWRSSAGSWLGSLPRSRYFGHLLSASAYTSGKSTSAVDVTPVTIKRCADKLVLRRLHKATFPADRYDLPPETLFWVAYDNVTPIGFVSLQRTDSDDGWYVSRIGSTVKGNNLGVKLLRVVDRFVEAEKRGGIVTYVLSTNGASIKTFILAGYRIYAPAEWWAGQDVVYFSKEIGSHRAV
jgi:hypothetical protein